MQFNELELTIVAGLLRGAITAEKAFVGSEKTGLRLCRLESILKTVQAQYDATKAEDGGPVTVDSAGAEVKGLIIDLYRPADGSDCTNGGISSRYTEALVIGPGIPPIFGASGRPVVRLEQNRGGGTARLVPLEKPGAWYMFGGCFGYTSDSRFSEAVRAIYGRTVHRAEYYGAVPLHDRTEG
jgi:hypothetical protein